MTDPEIEAYLATMRVPEKMHLNIEPEEGAFIRDLVRKLNAQRVLEIGTSTGYSGIWIALGLRETGGRLVTLELDRGRRAIAVENFRATGLDGIIDARLGDALPAIAVAEGPIDLAFLDAVKTDYLKYYEAAFPKMRRGGIILAHNVKSHPNEMRDFLDRINSDPAVTTEYVTLGERGQGLSVSRVQQ